MKEKFKQEEVLQAVVVADSFNRRFRPLTLEKPRCLLPLLNVPLIEYTLEFLAVAGVQEIFVVCCAHSEQIKDYLRQSRWNKSTMPVVTTIVSQELLSVGDALRDLDSKQLLQSDFILVSGDVVSNMNLELALNEHKNRKLVDKNSIMTMVVKEASPNHRSRAKGEECLLILDTNSKECLQYESLEAFPPKKRIHIESELFKEHSEVQVRNDLIDCQIDICSLEVPALFTENFDYQDIRKDFVRGILESDLLGKTIYCHVLSNEYATRVRSTQMYDAISRDVMARWTFPLVPDNNILGDTTYVCSRPKIYKEKYRVKLARSTVLEDHVTIGSSTEIGDNSRITNSVIGKGCRIGSNVIIDGAYIWNNVVIEDNCEVYRSIVADNVHIMAGVKVEMGCIVSYGVKIGAKVTLPAFTKLTATSIDEEATIAEKDLLGPNSVCRVWKDDYDQDEDMEDIDPRNLILGSLARELSNMHVDPEEADESTEEEETDMSDFETETETESNHREIALTLQRAFDDNHSNDIAGLELNTLKMALNVRFSDLRQVVIPGILNRIEGDSSKMAGTAKVTISRWAGLLKHFVHSEEDQIDCLDITMEYCLTNDTSNKLFLLALKFFYECDVIEEDAAVSWHTMDHPPKFSKLKEQVLPFINWLQEAEEESDNC